MPRASKFGSESVRVVVRCRPLNERELASSHQRIVEVDSKRGAVLLTNPKLQDEAPREFMFDAAYDSDSKQVDLYDESFRPLVDSVLEGFNGTIFAYGQTGTGKTFTMEGVRKDPELWGVIPRSFEHIFSHISASSNCQFLVRASYMEIYQEEIRDLLHKDQSRRLELKERPDTGTYVKDLSSFVCKSVKEISHIMSTGNANRSVGATDMNEHSSRSHAIFLVTVERGELSTDDGEMHFRMGKLNLVDLAGSERQAKTGAVGERFKEAAKINLSLSALGNVISALIDGKSSHIPYRDSKLTRLLQASLGGNARTIMVSNFGPASYNYEETLGTLRYASRAKNIKNKPKINEDPKDALLRQFQEEIAQLQAQLNSRTSGGSAHRRRKKGGARVDKEGSNAAAVSDAEDGSVVSTGDEDVTPDQSLEQQRQRLQQEHADILSNNNLIAEDRDRLLADMRQKQEQLDEERRAQQHLAARIASMQSKLLSGDDGNGIADRTNQQQQQLQLHKQRLVEQKIREREVLQQLEREEETRLDVQQTYTSLQQEVDVKSRKLKKLYRRLETAKRELHDAEDEFNQQRRELQAVQQTLYRELKLKTLILENFVPSEERVKLLNRCVYDDDEDMWKLSASASTSTSSSAGLQLERPCRPVSTPGSRRPVSELAAKRSALRYKYENLISLELDSPGRTTRQYTAPSVAPRVQAALQAALTPHEREINIDALSSLHVSNFLMKAATKPTSASSVVCADVGRSPSVLQNLSSPPPEMAPSRTGHNRPQHPTNPSSPSEPQLYPRARGLVPK